MVIYLLDSATDSIILILHQKFIYVFDNGISCTFVNTKRLQNKFGYSIWNI